MHKPPDVPVQAQVVIHLFMKDGRWGHWIQVKGEAITPARAMRLAARALRDRIMRRIW